MPLLGGAPTERATGVVGADWSPDGRKLAVVRLVETPKGLMHRVEFPVGAVVHEAEHRLIHPRVGPDGEQLAWTDGGAIVVRERTGKLRTISTGWNFVRGLDWSPDGREIWFTGQRPDRGPSEMLYAASLEGVERLIYAAAESVLLLDVAPSGRVLVAIGSRENRARRRLVGTDDDLDLSWFDFTVPDVLSPDGTKLLFTERGIAGGIGAYPIFVRGAGGATPQRLADGYGLAISTDNRLALTLTRPGRGPLATSQSELVLYPIGPGEPQVLRHDGLTPAGSHASFQPDNSSIVFSARRGDGTPIRVYRQRLGGEPPVLLDHELGEMISPLSPDGRQFISRRSDGSVSIVPVASGPAERLPIVLAAGEAIAEWSSDGRALFVVRRDPSLIVDRVTLVTGRREP